MATNHRISVYKKISINLLYVHLQVAIVALPQAGGKFRTTPHISLWAQAREWQLLRVGFFMEEV